jgi:RNA polymerase sigma factor (TIGR02999 family)
MDSSGEVTALLNDRVRGNRTALDHLVPLVCAQLRRIAARQLRQERQGHTLQPTALVHKAYFRLFDRWQVDWRNRAHFFGVAAQVMRRILVDHARRRNAIKRGDGVTFVSIDDVINTVAGAQFSIINLNDALARLEEQDHRLGQLVELRAFGGLTLEEAADVLNMSTSTAKREWRTAKAWLARELGSEERA